MPEAVKAEFRPSKLRFVPALLNSIEPGLKVNPTVAGVARYVVPVENPL
jgi:hypothetical protein